MMRIRKLFIWLFLIVAASLQAQLITVRGDFSRDTIMLGEQLRYTFTIDADSALRTSFPLFSDTLSSDIEVLELITSDTTREENRQIISTAYRVTSFRKGSNMVPPLPVAFSSGSIADTMYTYPSFLFVEAPEIDTTQAIRPIKGPVNTPVNFAELFPWLLAGLGVLLLIGGVIWLIRYYRKRREMGEGFIFPPAEPAHLIALRELDRLSEAGLPEKGLVKEYYTRLTEIIRRYMENAYQVPAMERITFEIIDEFAPHASGNQELLDHLRELLELADLVKFAREDPLPGENKRNLQLAYDFVNRTRAIRMEAEAALERAGEQKEKTNGETINKVEENE